MSFGPVVLVGKPCDCGGQLSWEKHGLLRPRWRLECICGRCGPWRNRPEVQRANPARNFSTSPDAPPSVFASRRSDRPGLGAQIDAGL